MSKKNLIFSTFGLLILISTFVSAYGYRNFDYSNPMGLIQNEWVLFLLIFAVFFSLIFFAISKTFQENRMTAVVISAVLSLIIAASLSEKFYLRQHFGQWVVLIAILIAVFSVLKIMVGHLGISAFLALITATLIFLRTSVDPLMSFPYEVISNPLFGLYDFFVNWFVIIILILITGYMIYYQIKEEKYHRAVRRKHKRELLAEHG